MESVCFLLAVQTIAIEEMAVEYAPFRRGFTLVPQITPDFYRYLALFDNDNAEIDRYW